MTGSFHDQFVATRDKQHSKNHPFFELWAEGKLTENQMAFYRTQHYYLVGEFLNWLAYQGSQIRERDVKNCLFENLGDEENPDDHDLDMLKDFVAVEKYCNTPELQALALKQVEEATARRWRYMNDIYWYALHGKADNTPTLAAWLPGNSKQQRKLS